MVRAAAAAAARKAMGGSSKKSSTFMWKNCNVIEVKWIIRGIAHFIHDMNVHFMEPT